MWHWLAAMHLYTQHPPAVSFKMGFKVFMVGGVAGKQNHTALVGNTAHAASSVRAGINQGCIWPRDTRNASPHVMATDVVPPTVSVRVASVMATDVVPPTVSVRVASVMATDVVPPTVSVRVAAQDRTIGQTDCDDISQPPIGTLCEHRLLFEPVH
jgi:hypothetical protein